MSPEPPVEKCEACVSSGGINRASLMPFHGYVAAHHALIARLRAQVVEQRQRAEMAEGAAKAKIEEVEELRAERDAARTELERVRAAGKEIEAALGSVLLVVEMEMRKAMSRENAIVELSSMQDYCRSIGPSISKARRVLGEGQK